MKNICYNPTWLVALEHPAERVVRFALMTCIGICAAVYLYTVGGTVLNLMARKEATLASARLQQNVAQLEARYLALLNTTDVTEGASLGLTPIVESSYIYRGGTALAVPRLPF